MRKSRAALLVTILSIGIARTSLAQTNPAPGTPDTPGPAATAAPTTDDAGAPTTPGTSAAPAVAPPGTPPTDVPFPIVPTPPTPPKEHAPVNVTMKPGKGVTFADGDRFSLTLRGRMMLRYTTTEHSNHREQEFTIRRARVYIGGHTFSKHIKYLFHAAFANQDYELDSRNPLYDAYVEFDHLKDLNLRVGQQLVPFNRARVISSQNAELVDRSPVNAELNLDRDVGVKAFSKDFLDLGHVLSYELFAGTGDGRNQLAGGMGMLYVGRIQVNPMGKFEDYLEADIEHTPTPKLSIGITGGYNHDTPRTRSTTSTRFTRTDFDYTHAAADMIFKWEGLAVEGEVLYRTAEQNKLDFKDAAGATKLEYSRSAVGYFGQIGYVLSSVPVGVAGRWSQLFTARKETDPTLTKTVNDQGKEIAASVNWFIHGHVFKIQSDYAYLFGDKFSDGRHLARVQMHVGY